LNALNTLLTIWDIDKKKNTTTHNTTTTNNNNGGEEIRVEGPRVRHRERVAARRGREDDFCIIIKIIESNPKAPFPLLRVVLPPLRRPPGRLAQIRRFVRPRRRRPVRDETQKRPGDRRSDENERPETRQTQEMLKE